MTRESDSIVGGRRTDLSTTAHRVRVETGLLRTGESTPPLSRVRRWFGRPRNETIVAEPSKRRPDRYACSPCRSILLRVGRTWRGGVFDPRASIAPVLVFLMRAAAPVHPVINISRTCQPGTLVESLQDLSSRLDKLWRQSSARNGWRGRTRTTGTPTHCSLRSRAQNKVLPELLAVFANSKLQACSNGTKNQHLQQGLDAKLEKALINNISRFI
jgi:hypothetical protein